MYSLTNTAISNATCNLDLRVKFRQLKPCILLELKSLRWDETF